jgi:hypothetical protein
MKLAPTNFVSLLSVLYMASGVSALFEDPSFPYAKSKAATISKVNVVDDYLCREKIVIIIEKISRCKEFRGCFDRKPCDYDNLKSRTKRVNVDVIRYIFLYAVRYIPVSNRKQYRHCLFRNNFKDCFLYLDVFINHCRSPVVKYIETCLFNELYCCEDKRYLHFYDSECHRLQKTKIVWKNSWFCPVPDFIFTREHLLKIPFSVEIAFIKAFYSNCVSRCGYKGDLELDDFLRCYEDVYRLKNIRGILHCKLALILIINDCISYCDVGSNFCILRSAYDYLDSLRCEKSERIVGFNLIIKAFFGVICK